MNAAKLPLFRNPWFRIITTWACSLIAPILMALMVLLILHASLASARQVFADRPYLTTYFEIAGVGLVPLIFSLAGREAFSRYGLTRRGLGRSLLLAAAVFALGAGYSYLTTGQWVDFASQTVHLGFPANLWYGLLGILTYGPLEVFFFVWLVDNTAPLFAGKRQPRLWSLLLTAVLFGLLHIVTTQSLANALHVGVLFLLLGGIYVYTGNSLGPMLAWTLLNGQVWFLAQLLWR